MGVRYSVLPLAGGVRSWISGEGISCPDVDGRQATPVEMAEAAAGVPGFEVEESAEDDWWQLSVFGTKDPATQAWTVVNALEFADRRSPCRFYFEKGWPGLIVEILKRLALVTGPIVLVPDTGCSPVVVTEDADAGVLLEVWD